MSPGQLRATDEHVENAAIRPMPVVPMPVAVFDDDHIPPQDPFRSPCPGHTVECIPLTAVCDNGPTRSGVRGSPERQPSVARHSPAAAGGTTGGAPSVDLPAVDADVLRHNHSRLSDGAGGGIRTPRSFEHGHLKTARLPFRHARNGGVDRTNLNTSDSVAALPAARGAPVIGPTTSSSGPRAARYRGKVSTTRRRRPALILLVTAAAAGCLALAWWQWTRFESTSGSFQNLGYAFQWPLFAGFCVYAYYKFVRYEEAPTGAPPSRGGHCHRDPCRTSPRAAEAGDAIGG